MMRKDEIITIHGKQYQKMTEELLEQAGLAEMVPSKDCLIGIKPNLVAPVLANEGGTTHPEVVEGLICYLQRHGFSRLVMLEGSWVGDFTEDAINYCGYGELSKRYAVPFWDMQKESGEQTECGGMTLNLCKRAKDIEFMINVPVLKGHCQTKITCALKNMKGLLPNSEKRRFHRLGLQDPIAHLALGIHQDFILVDNICGDLTFEDGGNPVVQDRLLAAADPVLCDAYCCSLLGIGQTEVPYIAKAAVLGAGSCDLTKVKHTAFWEQEEADGRVSYEMRETQQEPAAPSGFRKVMKLAELAEEVDSCSACYGYLIPTLHRLEQEGLLAGLKEKICIGQGHRGRCGQLGVGNCTRNFKHTLEGCPPTDHQMYEFLKAYIREHSETELES